MMYSFSEDRIDDCNGEVVWSNFEQRANESPCSDIIHMAAFAPPHFRADVLNENTSSIPINAFQTCQRSISKNRRCPDQSPIRFSPDHHRWLSVILQSQLHLSSFRIHVSQHRVRDVPFRHLLIPRATPRPQQLHFTLSNLALELFVIRI
jgi:hypothetical protein